MQETPEDEEPDLLPFPSFEQFDCTEAVRLRFVPKDEPRPGLLAELVAAFTEAAERPYGIFSRGNPGNPSG